MLTECTFKMTEIVNFYPINTFKMTEIVNFYPINLKFEMDSSNLIRAGNAIVINGLIVNAYRQLSVY